MKRPLFICVLSLLSGILLISLTDKMPGAAIICLDLVLIRGTFDKKKRKNMYLWSVVVAVFGLLSGHFSHNIKSPLAEGYAEDSRSVFAEGKVTAVDYTYSGRQKLTVQLCEIYTAGGEKNKANIKAQIILEQEQFVSCGSEIVVTGILQSLEPARNPGGYNEALYLGARKFDYKMYGNLESEELAVNFHFIMDKIRNKVSDCYDKVLPKREAGILKSMILGDKSGLDDYVKDMYREAGIYHILVISGLHISITVLFIQWLLSHFISVKKAAAISIAFICLYCVFSGAGVSAVRAVIMAVILIVAGVIYREADLISSASFAAILLLIYEPLYAFDIGFQYSFSAVFGLGLLSGYFGEGLNNIAVKGLSHAKVTDKEMLVLCTKFCNALGGCLAVFIATIPVQIYHFNYVFPLSVIANMIILPLAPVIVVLGLLIAIAGLFNVFAAHVAAGIVYALLDFYEAVCLLLDNIPVSKLLMATPAYMLCVLFIICIILFAACLDLRVGAKKAAAAGILFFAIFSIAFAAVELRENVPSVTILDVGQGDCTVIQNGEEVFIIDGGGWYGREIGKNTGASVLVPYLDHKGIAYVDKVFISHLDFDHATGIVELINEKSIGMLYMPEAADRKSELYIIISKICEEKGVGIKYLSRGDRIMTESGVGFMVLSPESGREYKDDNASSMVLFMNMGLKYVFTGDIAFSEEENIADSFKNIEADVLKLAHHGSKYSTGEVFLDTLKPEIAIAGAGVNNSYGHPSEEVQERLKQRNIDFYSTKSHGAVIIFKEGGIVKIKTMLEGE